MNKNIVISIMYLFFSSVQLAADEVYLVNGDRITGKIKTMENGKLTIESDLAGKLTLDLNSVATFKTSEPVEIQLKDGTGFKKQISKAETGRFAVEGDLTLKAQDFNVASIVVINPPVKEAPKWHGSISGALVSTHGNTNINTRSFSINLNKRAENDRTQLSTDYFYGKQRNTSTGEEEVTQDEWKARGQYDYFFTKKAFGFIDTRYERDRIADLERRVVVGVGGGYQWVESEPFNFSTQAGIASRYETYTNDSPSSSQMSVQLGYHLDKKLNKTFMVINDLTYYPSIEETSDYFLTTTGELRAKVTEQFFMNFKVVFDFDSTPAEGKHKSDVKYILGVGATF